MPSQCYERSKKSIFKATYITVNDETANLPNSVRHVNVAEAEKHTPKLHKDSHRMGGGDSFSVNDLLDAVARVNVRKNSGASDVGSRRRLNFIEGANVTLTVADDPTDEEVDVTIASSGGGSGGSLEDHWMDIAKQIAVLRPSYYDHNYVTGTATITRYPSMWQLYVGTIKTSIATARNRALALGYATLNFWDKNPQFATGFNIDTLTSGADNIDVRILLAEFSLALSENELTASRRRIGVRISGTTLYLLTNPGAASDTMVQIKTGLPAGFHRVRVKLVSNTKAQVWLDDDAV